MTAITISEQQNNRTTEQQNNRTTEPTREYPANASESGASLEGRRWL